MNEYKYLMASSESLIAASSREEKLETVKRIKTRLDLFLNFCYDDDKISFRSHIWNLSCSNHNVALFAIVHIFLSIFWFGRNVIFKYNMLGEAFMSSSLVMLSADIFASISLLLSLIIFACRVRSRLPPIKYRVFDLLLDFLSSKLLHQMS